MPNCSEAVTLDRLLRRKPIVMFLFCYSLFLGFPIILHSHTFCALVLTPVLISPRNLHFTHPTKWIVTFTLCTKVPHNLFDVSDRKWCFMNFHEDYALSQLLCLHGNSSLTYFSCAAIAYLSVSLCWYAEFLCQNIVQCIERVSFFFKYWYNPVRRE